MVRVGHRFQGNTWQCQLMHLVMKNNNILRKTIEGYLDSVPSLTFNAIKSKPIMHAFNSSGYLQSN